MYIRSLLIFVVTIAITINFVKSEQLCNGHAELCNKPFDELTYILTHNSYGYIANPAANQLCPISTQLSDGVRGLKLSAVRASNASSAAEGIQLCHTSCTILNAGSAVDTLKEITNWVKSNPNEVITIMWNNIGNFTPEAFKTAYEASGILDYVHIQEYANFTWPTLGEMISSGKRVVNFLDEGADAKAVPWLMPEWGYVFETPYNNYNESSFNCVIDRPYEPYNPEEVMYVMNHFLYGTLTLGSLLIEIPQKGTANVTNSDSSLLRQAQICQKTFGRQPNFLEVDFYNKGDALTIAAQLNNVTYNAQSPLQCDAYEQKQVSNTGGSSSSQANIQHTTMYSTTILLSLVATAFFVYF
ncbi:PLC-like phosphodiesterase [Mycotypha africana]|uniref:PLC-like phosphodiesterase n=1 Tax=Mycotypha africana TaxID=64632 RepID=UPI002301766B|nr:PLC-like phosphodiesterase [Mycotypha africana]KAI8981905.1 PLC-like phosphodiesterase [Mycotypha africana]